MLVGYKFEYSPTPLVAGGVGMYIDEDLNNSLIEKASENAFQALWIEIQFPKQANVICAGLLLGVESSFSGSSDAGQGLTRFLVWAYFGSQELPSTGQCQLQVLCGGVALPS